MKCYAETTFVASGSQESVSERMKKKNEDGSFDELVALKAMIYYYY